MQIDNETLSRINAVMSNPLPSSGEQRKLLEYVNEKFEAEFKSILELLDAVND